MGNDLKAYLCDLVGRIKTYSYDFDLELTRYSETNGDQDRRAILDCIEELLKEGRTDAAFAGLYLFTIYLKNDNNTMGLETVVTRYEQHFEDEKYPLMLELKSRYLKRKSRDLEAWRRALECDKRALELLHGLYFAKSTYGLNASYVSTLCRILEYGVKNSASLNAIKDFIGVQDVEYGIRCISENIRNNGSYAKNYFLKAQLMYYAMVAFEGEPEKEIEQVEKRCEACDAMIAELDRAILAEESMAKQDTYRAFAETIIAYQSQLAASISEEWKAQLKSAASFDSCDSPMCHAKLSGRKYAYVCYSRNDYKEVFEDIYWLYCNNISVEYDRIVKSGSKWSTSVKEAMLDNDCAVVVFCLSGSVFTSDSLYKEITMVRSSSKSYFFISVAGEATSKMLYDLYNAEPYEPLFKNTLTSDRLSQVISFFNDSIHYISRTEKDYGRKLAGDLKHYFNGQRELRHEASRDLTGAGLLTSTYLAQNDRIIDGVQKPNEDTLICDEEAGIFIVADGVTRPHSEYAVQEPSAAFEVSKLFCNSVYRKVKGEIFRCTNGYDVEKLLTDAFVLGNEQVAQWNENWTITHQSNKMYQPAAVALCACLYKNMLYYCYIGDCIGILIRNDCRYVFAERQTRAVSKLKPGKEQLYLNYVNKPGRKHAYGIINGDKLAPAMMVHSHFALEDGDKVILSTDGLADMLLSESTQILASQSLTSILPSLAAEYDVPPFAQYGDDKALIDITVKSLI